MVAFSLIDIIVVTILATKGIWMAPIPLSLTLGLLGITAFYFLLLDLLKVQIVKLFKQRSNRNHQV
jgi:hypothetical protein